jgi:16S rRNA (uracil1498-N3)-methyltransferase
LHRFFLPSDSFQKDRIIFPKETAHQVSRVLRLRAEDNIIVLDNSGFEYEAILTLVEGSQVEAEISAKHLNQNEPSVALSLYLCLTQREKFEFILQKCTELGVSSFIPVISSRSLVQVQKDWQTRKTRYEKIITEAAEQSGRGKIPQLLGIMRFENLPQLSEEDGPAFILFEGEKDLSLRHGLRDVASQAENPSVNLLVGPEGGLSTGEVEAAIAKGFRSVTVGKRILRMETAAIISCALVFFELGAME